MMSLYRTTDGLKTPATSWVSAMLDGIRRRASMLRDALERRSRLVRVDAQTVQDTRLPAETLTGIGTWQEELPFFMQSGFGRTE